MRPLKPIREEYKELKLRRQIDRLRFMAEAQGSNIKWANNHDDPKEWIVSALMFFEEALAYWECHNIEDRKIFPSVSRSELLKIKGFLSGSQYFDSSLPTHTSKSELSPIFDRMTKDIFDARFSEHLLKAAKAF